MAAKADIMKVLNFALENISKESLKNFKSSLCVCSVRPPYQSVPCSLLDDKSAKEVVDTIIRYYTIDYGADITVKVLEDINERQVSHELQESINTAKQLRDATNRMCPSHRRLRQRQECGKENFSDFEDQKGASVPSRPMRQCRPDMQLAHCYQKRKKVEKVKRSMDLTTVENRGETSKNQRGASVPSRPMRQCRPDMRLPYLTPTHLELMTKNHKGKVHRFACLLFKHFVPFDTYQKWTRNTNFDGCGEKLAIPGNLRCAILTEVRKHFSLTQNDERQIKRAINELLSAPRRGRWPILI